MNTVIYYPHFYPTDHWLKLASLCWDKVYTLRPPDAPIAPASIVNLDKTVGGVLASVFVYPSRKLFDQFDNWIESRMERLKAESWSIDEKTESMLFWSKFAGRGRGMVEHLGELGLARFEEQETELQMPVWEVDEYYSRHMETEVGIVEPEPGSDHEKYLRLTEEADKKLRSGDSDNYQKLKRKAADIRQRNMTTITDTKYIVYLPKDIASHYLSLCALQAAIDGNRDLAADTEKFTDIVFHNVRAVRGEIATAILQANLPRNLSIIEPKRIAEIRSEFGTERLKYQKVIHDLLNDFSELSAEYELNSLRSRIADIAQERIQATKRAYKRANIEIAIKTIGVTLTPPAIATALASALGIGLFAPLGIVTALSLFAASRLIELDKARSDKAQDPWSYVIESAKRI